MFSSYFFYQVVYEEHVNRGAGEQLERLLAQLVGLHANYLIGFVEVDGALPDRLVLAHEAVVVHQQLVDILEVLLPVLQRQILLLDALDPALGHAYDLAVLDAQVLVHEGRAELPAQHEVLELGPVLVERRLEVRGQLVVPADVLVQPLAQVVQVGQHRGEEAYVQRFIFPQK